MKSIFTLLLSCTMLAAPTLHAADNTATQKENGKNIIRFAPIALFDVGVGMGLSYERFIEKSYKISVVIPIDYLFASFENNGGYYSDESNKTSYFYFAPGLKFYPSSANKKVTYAIGPNLYLGYGQGRDWIYQGNTGYYAYEDYNNTRFGILATNYLDINITPSFNLGFSLAVGIRYSSNYNYDNYSMTYDQGVSPVAQFKFTMGYRF